jgi:uncharacterized membrane protein
MQKENRLLAASAYLFGVPALYIILTGERKRPMVGEHGAQALLLWISFFAIFFLLRLAINLLWLLVYIPHLDYLETLAVLLMAGYAIRSAWRVIKGQPIR